MAFQSLKKKELVELIKNPKFIKLLDKIHFLVFGSGLRSSPHLVNGDKEFKIKQWHSEK
jgi:hypothetical protein